MLARRLSSALRPLLTARPLQPLQPPLASCRLLSRRARPQERPVERRQGPDGQWVSRAMFRMTYPGVAWDSAEVERRRDTDGNLYTLSEFQSFHAQFVDGSSSDVDGVAYEHWTDAKHWEHKMTKQIQAEKSTNSLLALHREYHDALNYIHLSTLWHRLGALDRSQRLRRKPAQLDALREHTLAMMPQFGEQALSNINLSLARSGLSQKPPWPKLWIALGAAAQGRVGAFNEQVLSNKAWAFAVADARCDALFGGPHFVQACERHEKSLLRNRNALAQLEVWRQWRDACSADGRTWPTLSAPLLAACQAAGCKGKAAK